MKKTVALLGVVLILISACNNSTSSKDNISSTKSLLIYKDSNINRIFYRKITEVGRIRKVKVWSAPKERKERLRRP